MIRGLLALFGFRHGDEPHVWTTADYSYSDPRSYKDED